MQTVIVAAFFIIWMPSSSRYNFQKDLMSKKKRIQKGTSWEWPLSCKWNPGFSGEKRTEWAALLQPPVHDLRSVRLPEKKGC